MGDGVGQHVCKHQQGSCCGSHIEEADINLASRGVKAGVQHLVRDLNVVYSMLFPFQFCETVSRPKYVHFREDNVAAVQQ